ncbi:MAG TPA: DUF86 domain-containing protein [Longimicrobiaceae bacterium]|nr:DUF86 domain-containing protein [Longimicrobiaceae bacterium]
MLPDRVRLQHMLDATRKALEFTRDRSRPDLDRDEMLALALVRLLEIVGEAAKNVTRPTRELAPRVPWRQVAGTRDRLTHGYFDVDLDIVWTIVQRDLPTLRAELEGLLERLPGEPRS